MELMAQAVWIERATLLDGLRAVGRYHGETVS